jgi:hypothetical protein
MIVSDRFEPVVFCPMVGEAFPRTLAPLEIFWSAEYTTGQSRFNEGILRAARFALNSEHFSAPVQSGDQPRGVYDRRKTAACFCIFFKTRRLV